MDLIAPSRSVLTAKALDYSDDEQKIFVSTIAKRVVLRTQPATELQLVGYVVATDTALPDSSADERHVERCPGAVAHQPL
jgi:hypothetical protein